MTLRIDFMAYSQRKWSEAELARMNIAVQDEHLPPLDFDFRWEYHPESTAAYNIWQRIDDRMYDETWEAHLEQFWVLEAHENHMEAIARCQPQS